MMKEQESHNPEVKAKIFVPKGKALYEISGTTFLVDEKYQVMQCLGKGAYGIVASAVNKQTSQKVAIKKITNAFDDPVDAKRILREIKLLKFLKHDNIVGLIDVLKPESRTGYNDVYIITELMSTNLNNVIYLKNDLTEEHIQYIMYQLLRGLLYMHSADILHRDLKPSNLLLNKKCLLKICDMGLSRGYVNEDDRKTVYVVTRHYRAPQIILKASQYSKAIDVWSAGCILAQLLGKTVIFPGWDYLDQIKTIISILGTPSQDDLKYIEDILAVKYIKTLPKRSKQSWMKLLPGYSLPIYDLLNKMLTFNPDNRWSVQQCLQHPYFKQLHQTVQQPLASQTFDWNWDNFQPTSQRIQNMIYNESLFFHLQRSYSRSYSKDRPVSRYTREKSQASKHF